MQDILIVEDGLHERERLRRLFAGAQYSVSCAESAHEAENFLATDQFRLAILDIGLEDKSGSLLFQMIRKQAEIQYIIILTGNPSIHLKQRFLDEGAYSYIVKASPAASNDALLTTVRSLLGPAAAKVAADGVPLAEFIKRYLTEASRDLFYDADEQFPPCPQCGGKSYQVSFSHKTQLPPVVEGRVICLGCSCPMDPEVG